MSSFALRTIQSNRSFHSITCPYRAKPDAKIAGIVRFVDNDKSYPHIKSQFSLSQLSKRESIYEDLRQIPIKLRMKGMLNR
jgi:hypothetical protein